MDSIQQGTDIVFERLLAARREQVVSLQKAQAEELADLESRGQGKLATLKKSLPKELGSYLAQQEEAEPQLAAAAQKEIEAVETRLAETAPTESTALSVVMGNSPAAAAVGWLSPYHGTLHGSDGSVYWQGYNPGNINASCFANGSGSGVFGTGAASFAVYMDWWFTFNAPANRNYAHTVYVPFNGFYIARADDGWFDSKQAKLSISLSATGYQYNYKPTGTANVLSVGNDNINVNDRFDGWRTMYYSDLLGADRAYLRVTAKLYVYARGGGSTAQLNFSTGDANHLGVPLVYVT